MAPSRVPQKRILGEAKNTQQSNTPSTPSSAAKKRKLEPVASSPAAARFKSSQNGPKGKLASSQPSHFESEVLEKMTQDMESLKKNNSEKDQEWARPGLADFNPEVDNLIFQQIECEEGTYDHGKATVKLFGVTEVSFIPIPTEPATNTTYRLVTQLCYMLKTSYITFTSPLLLVSHIKIVKDSKHTLIHK